MSAPYAPPPGPPPVPTTVPPAKRRRGKRTLIVGIALMVVATLAIGASLAAWFVLGKTSTDGAQITTMPGSISMGLKEGDWAFYTEVVDGSHPTISTEDVTIEGPGEVTTETTWGFFSDTTSIELAGTEYEVVMRLYVPQDGTYDITIARDDSEEIPVVVGIYPDDEVLATVVFWTIFVAAIIGFIGFIVTIVGFIMWLTGLGKKTSPPAPYYPTSYPTA